MDWSVVAREAGGVGGFRRESAGLLEVTGGAFFFEDGVGGAHAAAGVNARVFRGGAPGDPDQGDDREQQSEPELGTLIQRRPFEIVEVDALGEFLCCACACHVSPENGN